MGYSVDLSGKIFDDIEVIERAVEDYCFKSHNTHWLCRCRICGDMFIARGYELKTGAKTFCNSKHKNYKSAKAKRVI